MPTIYSKCNQCVYFSHLSLDHFLNDKHKDNLEKQEILINLGIPKELCIKIIYKSNMLNREKCSYCEEMLCNYHANIGKKDALKFNKNGIMCYNCCHWEM